MAKRKKRIVTHQPKLNLVLLTLLILLIFLMIFRVGGINWSMSTRINHVADNTKANKISTQSEKPTPTPEPKYTGFCLNVPILLYHHIKPLDSAGTDAFLTVDISTFESQLQYLIRAGYQTISVVELANALINHQPLPAKSVVITLDDGYMDVYTNAYPLLYRYKLKANLMIATGLLGNSGYLSWDQLKRMVDTGLIFAYDHSWSHVQLANLPDEKIKYEILTGQKQLEEKLGKQINIFAYPYGSENQRTIDILKQNGFIAALSTVPGSIQCDSFLMSLHRIRIGNAPLFQYGI